MRELRVLAGVAIALALSTPGWSAEDPLQGDLRDLRVGMQVGDLPAVGYVGLACGNDGGEPGQALASWAEFDRCPADAAGLHEVAFEYDELAAALGRGQRQMGGHPGRRPPGDPLAPDRRPGRGAADPDRDRPRSPPVPEEEGVPAADPGHGPLRPRRLGLRRRGAGRGHDPGRRHVHRSPLREDVPRSPAGARDPPVSHRRAERPGVHRPDPARDHQRPAPADRAHHGFTPSSSRSTPSAIAS